MYDEPHAQDFQAMNDTDLSQAYYVALSGMANAVRFHDASGRSHWQSESRRAFVEVRARYERKRERHIRALAALTAKYQ